MKSKFINVLMFAVGAAIGSAVTWKVLKTKYDATIQAEIDAIKEGFAEVYGSNEEPINVILMIRKYIRSIGPNTKILTRKRKKNIFPLKKM